MRNKEFCGPVVLYLLLITIFPLVFGQFARNEQSDSLSVCTAHFQPLVLCKDGKEPKGYHIELFKLSAAALGLRNYTFKCLPFGDMIQDLLDGGLECDMGVGGITITTARMNMGLAFSFPTYRGSLGVLVKGYVNEGSTWSFMMPLHWTVWLAVGLTTLIIPMLVFVVESFSCHGFVHRLDLSRGMRQAIWDSFVTLLNFGNFKVTSHEARIIVVGYGFLVLILLNTYVANLAAFLTITNIESSIKTVDDLEGKRVVAGGVYEKRLRQQQVPVRKTFDSVTKYDAIEQFRAGGSHFDALIYDEPWVTFMSGEDCTLFVLTETVSPFDYGFVFPNRQGSTALEEDFSQNLVFLQENGTMQRLMDSYVTIQQRDCPLNHQVNETQAVHFDHMVGLWIIMAFCVAISLVSLSVRLVKRWFKKRLIEEHLHKQTKKDVIQTVYHPHASLRRSQALRRDESVSRPQVSGSLPLNPPDDVKEFEAIVYKELAEMKQEISTILERARSQKSQAISELENS